MDRKQNHIRLTALLIALLLLLECVADAAARRVVVLMSHEGPPYQETLEGIQQHLRSSDQEIDLDIVHAEGDTSKLSGVIEKIKGHDTYLIVTLGTLATDFVANRMIDIPVIAGLVLQLDNKKNKNISWVKLDPPITIQIEWIKRFFPGDTHIAILYNSSENSGRIQEIRKAANSSGLDLSTYEIYGPGDIPVMLKRIAKECNVIWSIPDSVVFTPQTAKHILLFSHRNRIPLIGLSSAWVKAGALYAIEADYSDLGLQLGEMVSKVLSGHPITSIPPEQLRSFRLSINRRTAEHMKLTIPDSILNDAWKLF